MMPLLLVPTMTRCYLHNCRLHLSSAILPPYTSFALLLLLLPSSIVRFLAKLREHMLCARLQFPSYLSHTHPPLLPPAHTFTSIHPALSFSGTYLSHSALYTPVLAVFVSFCSPPSPPPSLARESSILHPLSCDRPTLPWSQVPECLSPTEAIKSSAQSFLASKSVKQKAEPTYSVYSPQSTKTKPKKTTTNP